MSGREIDFNIPDAAFVFVRWVDSATTGSGWISKEYFEENLGSLEIESVGILYKQTKDFITIVQSVADSCVDNNMSIPKCSILDLQRIVFDD